MAEQILVVDDDDKITSMLRRGLAFEGYRVRVAHHGRAGLEAVADDEPDLVILDIMMPDLDGFEVCRRLREAGSKVSILMLTAKDEVNDRVKGLDYGADDYLVKPFALEELLARIRALLRRKADQEDAANKKLSYKDIMMDLEARQAFRGGRRMELTHREFELLKLLLENPRRVLSKDLLMDRIWGYDHSGESNVLEVYVAMLRQKTELNGENRLIQTVRGSGYVMREEN